MSAGSSAAFPFLMTESDLHVQSSASQPDTGLRDVIVFTPPATYDRSKRKIIGQRRKGIMLVMAEIREVVFVKRWEKESAFTTGNVTVSQPWIYAIQEQRREGSSEPWRSWLFFRTDTLWRFQSRANFTTSGLVWNSLGLILATLTDSLGRLRSLPHWRFLPQFIQNSCSRPTWSLSWANCWTADHFMSLSALFLEVFVNITQLGKNMKRMRLWLKCEEKFLSLFIPDSKQSLMDLYIHHAIY